MEKSRACASLIGGAIGDALGMALEIFPKSNNLNKIHEQVLTQRSSRNSNNEGLLIDYESGGPWKDNGKILQAGEWTDDTAMMLCLADSLLIKKTFDISDLMLRFVNWWFNNYNSCNGQSLGLGGNVRKAIYSFNPDNPNVLLGGKNPEKDAGNGSLMRLAPVPIYYHNDYKATLYYSRYQTATTHFVHETLDGSTLMASVIWQAINGKSKSEIFDNMMIELTLKHPEIAELASVNAAWRTKEEHEIRTLPGRCLWSLEAALWCVYHSDTFEEAIIKAVNLGGDADTVGSITGQIAGAIYGMKAIPERWKAGLWHYDKILRRAEALFDKTEYDTSMNLR